MKATTDYDRITTTLADEGISILPNYFPTKVTQQLLEHVRSLPNQSLKTAGIGAERTINNE